MPRFDSEGVDKFRVFVVLMQFLYNFRELSLYVLTVKSTKNESFAVHYLKSTLQRFAPKHSRMTPNESKNRKSSTRFFATYVLFESFSSQNVGKRSTRMELIIQ